MFRWRALSFSRSGIIMNASVHIRIIAAKISRDCSHTDAERKFGVGVSRGPSLRSKKKMMGEWGTRRGGLLTSTLEHHMKMALATATLLSIIATPVLAQSFDPDMGTGNIDFNWQGGNGLAHSPAVYEAERARAEAVRRMYPPEYRSGHESKRTHRNEGND